MATMLLKKKTASIGPEANGILISGAEFDNRRRADRVIWAGLGRSPKKGEIATIVVELVSARKRDRLRDYVAKRGEYPKAGVKEYWGLDRFQRYMTVFTRGRKGKRLIKENQTYATDLLPGFELKATRLFRLADRWDAEEA